MYPRECLNYPSADRKSYSKHLQLELQVHRYLMGAHFDAEEELWRPWRLVDEPGSAAQAAVRPCRGRSAAAAAQPSTRRRKGQSRRRWWPYACWWSCALMPRAKRRKVQHVT